MKGFITLYCIVCGLIFLANGHAELSAIYNGAALVIIALGNRPNPPRNA